jgi:ElaB/YqjD/DUF883 family membrane-anchored ribosome-binding protein
MTDTLDAIGAKLDPSHLVDQAKDAFASSARDAGSSLMDSVKDSSVLDTIKDHPVPALAVGLSLAWFVSKLGESESEKYRRERYAATGDPYYAPRYYERGRYGAPAYGGDTGPLASRQRPLPSGPGSGTYPGASGEGASGGGASDEGVVGKASDALDTAADAASDLASDAQDAAADAVRTAKDKASDLTHSARDGASGAAGHARDHAQHYARRTESWLDRQIHANPLAIGTVALAAGALVGLSIPETEAENRAMGEQADAAKEKALHAAKDKADAAQEAVEDLGEEAGAKAERVAETAGEKARKISDEATSKAKKVADKATNEAEKTADKATADAKASGAKASGGATSKTARSKEAPRSKTTAASKEASGASANQA